MPIGTDGNRKWPFWSVTADRENPRSWLVMVTVTPGITPPDASWVVPETVPVWTPCAKLNADPPHNRHSKTNAAIRVIWPLLLGHNPLIVIMFAIVQCRELCRYVRFSKKAFLQNIGVFEPAERV